MTVATVGARALAHRVPAVAVRVLIVPPALKARPLMRRRLL